jgi:D-alanyl-D-alanine carboxypeptidase
LAAKAAGYSLDDAGVAQTFSEVLSSFGMKEKSVVIQDASGLSRDNRITAKQVAELLFKIRKDSKFAALIGGLPVGGVTGTLRHRFIKQRHKLLV